MMLVQRRLCGNRKSCSSAPPGPVRLGRSLNDPGLRACESSSLMIVHVRKSLTVAAVATSVILAFAFRVLPAYQAVFTAHGVSFQEPDAYFHMRTIHNLLAHFPCRSADGVMPDFSSFSFSLLRP